jgi:ABC-type antimicrobial peptide transport system permease subunit
VPEGHQFPTGKTSIEVLSSVVDHNFFGTFGVPLLRGRPILATDLADSPRVAVVNEAFAEHYLGENPIGKRIQIKDREKGDPWVQVVGVTTTGQYLSIVAPPTEYLYLPLSQNARTRMTLLAESYGDPAALAAPLRKMVGAIDSNVPISGVRTMGDFFEQRAVKTLHFIDGIVGVAGLLGLALALVGLYGVMAYQVARRTREIGIRMAIGARAGDIARRVTADVFAMVIAGALAGLGLGMASVRYIETLLYGVKPGDPAMLALPSLTIVGVALLAALPAVIRATRIDPVAMLRAD